MKLMPEQEWVKDIEELKKNNAKSTKVKLKNQVICAVNSLIPGKKFGILFSGGVDSALIALLCQKAGADFVCFCVGLTDSPDLAWAREVAEKYGFKLKIRVIDKQEIEPLFRRTKKMLSHVDTLSIGVGSVLAAGIEIGKKMGISDFFTGLGSEEIFAGYHFHEEADDVNAECWKRLKSMWRRDLKRDCAVALALDVKLLTPFLDKSIIQAAMGIDSEYKIDDSDKKIILRRIAEDIGLDKKFAWRPKKAAQYGSWFDKMLAKLARTKGFNTKQGYIDSL